MRYFFLAIFLYPLIAFGQNKSLDKVIKELDFSQDTMLAVYNWVTDNIRYDIDKVGSGVYYLQKQDFVADVIKSKRGVCQHYSELFNAIANELGYEAYVIGGYVLKNGEISDDIGHAWNVVKRDGDWKLYDSTWGAGLLDGRTFRKRYDKKWFETDPEVFIKTHVPFDPIWQLRKHPVNNFDYAKGQLNSSVYRSFNYKDSINLFSRQDEKSKLMSSYKRMKNAGLNNRVLKDWIKVMERNIEVFEHNEKVEVMNSHVDILNNTIGEMNQVVSTFNNYIEGKNRRFKSSKWTDERLKQTIVDMRTSSTKALSNLRSIRDTENDDLRKNVRNNLNSLLDIRRNIDQETEFMIRYIEANPIERKALFR